MGTASGAGAGAGRRAADGPAAEARPPTPLVEVLQAAGRLRSDWSRDLEERLVSARSASSAAGVVLAARGASMLRLVVYGGGIYACSLMVVSLLCASQNTTAHRAPRPWARAGRSRGPERRRAKRPPPCSHRHPRRARHLGSQPHPQQRRTAARASRAATLRSSRVSASRPGGRVSGSLSAVTSRTLKPPAASSCGASRSPCFPTSPSRSTSTSSRPPRKLSSAMTGENEAIAALTPDPGAGKTTLLEAIAGIAPATSGSVYFDGIDMHAHPDTFRNVLGYVPQEDILHADLALPRTLRYSARLRLPSATTRDEVDDAVGDAIDGVGLQWPGRRPGRLPEAAVNANGRASPSSCSPTRTSSSSMSPPLASTPSPAQS